MAAMTKAPNPQYNLQRPDSFSARLATGVRRQMFDRFLQYTSIQPADTVLDVGVTPDQTFPSSNYFEAWYPHKDRITAVGLDDASFLERLYPGLKFRHADGRELPFEDAAFDFVHSSAVLEHVGGADNQRRFLGELVRVARRAAFITTPNRWFPIEFHTVMPLVHWLPKERFRALMRRMNYDFFAHEENLNLVGRSELRKLCSALDHCRIGVDSVSVLGWPSNLILMISK
jgi:ubiquinone/menaquinone biosynthesis C-methylase UbiE